MGHALRSALSCMVLVAAAAAAQAATFPYPSCTGTTVGYTNISESGDDAQLYYSPTCNGDALDFEPQGFAADSGSSNPDFIDGQVNFTVAALQGFAVSGIQLDENGDVHVFGSEPSSTAAAVTLTVRLEILVEAESGNLEVEYYRRTPLVFDEASGSLVPGAWTLSEDFVIAAILADACGGAGFFHASSGGVDGSGGTGPIAAACGATSRSVDLVIDNTLVAFSGAGGEFAFINKKDFDGFSITTETEPVPEPASAALCALGMVVLALARRWRV